MKNLIALIAVCLAFSSSAQVSINAGGSMLAQFSPNKPWGGFHIGFEVPRDDAVSIYGRFTHHFRNFAQDSLDIFLSPRDINSMPPGAPFYPTIGSLPSMNYNIIEGGTRYYLGNGFDYGWAAYGGSNLMLIFNKVKGNHAAYDEVLYVIEETSRYEGSIFSFGFGLGGGVKYSSAMAGTFYFDLNASYLIFNQPSVQNIYGGLHSSLLFSFNLGYRRDILW